MGPSSTVGEHRWAAYLLPMLDMYAWSAAPCWASPTGGTPRKIEQKTGPARADAATGLKLKHDDAPTIAHATNGWQTNTDTMDDYGNYRLERAIGRLTQSILSTSAMPAVTRSWQKNKYVLFQQNELPPVVSR